MKEPIEQRIEKLRAEFEEGRQTLERLEVRHLDVRNSMLRIDGAIRVLEELREAEGGPVTDAAPETAGAAEPVAV